jgi:hypothetical protein
MIDSVSEADSKYPNKLFGFFQAYVKTPISRVLELHQINLTVVFLYFLFTLIFTFPLIRHLSTSTPMADGQGDQFQSMWMFWWFKTALFNLKTSPFFTNFLFYPHGSSLIYHMPIFLGLLSIPFQYLFGALAGLIIGFNLLLMFTFILSGFGVFLLTRYLIKNPIAAFICGLIFAFSSYRLSNLNHLNLLSTQWIPFYILCLIRSVDEKLLKYAIWAGVFFIFTFLSDFTCTLFLVFFTMMYLGFKLIKSRKQLLDIRLIRNWSLVLLAVIIILSPLLYNLYSTPVDWQAQAQGSIMYSANLLGYLLPVKEKSLMGSLFLPSRNDYTGVAGEELFLGYTLLFLVVFTWIKIHQAGIKFWFFSSLAFWVLSLGHAIQVYNHTYQLNWLPYNLLYTYIPLLHMGRTPCRFSLMVSLGLIVFSGYGLSRICSESKTFYEQVLDIKNFLKVFLVRKGTPLILVGLICLEFIMLPITLIRVEIPECYQKLKETPGDFAIMEVPVSFTRNSMVANVYMYYQTVHEKKVVNGFLTRPSIHSRDFLQELSSNVKMKLDSTTVEKLAQNDVKYLLVHDYQRSLQGTLVFEDTSQCVFREEFSKIAIYQLF